jgi:hypothetical protein
VLVPGPQRYDEGVAFLPVERLAVDHNRAAAAEAWSMLVLVWRRIVFFRCGPAYWNATGHGLLIRRLVEYLEGTIMEVQNEARSGRL